MRTDPDDQVANAAGNALAGIGKPAIPAILTLLRDGNAAAQKWALEILTSISTGENFESESQERGEQRRAAARSALRSALGDRDERVQLGASAAFKVLGPSAVPDLVSALDDPQPAIRIGTVRMLGALGADALDALDSLRQHHKDSDPEMRTAVETAIRAIEQSEHFEVVRIPLDP